MILVAPVLALGVNRTPRSGFTLIELLVVLGILAILGMLSIPAAMAASQRSAVNQCLANIERVCSQARMAARRTPPPIDPTDSAHYGVMVVQEGGNRFLALLHGTSITDAAIDLVDGSPTLRVSIPASVKVLTALGSATPTPLAGRIGWFYRYGDGAPIQWPANQLAISVGTSEQPARPGERTVGSPYWNFAPPLPLVKASPVCATLSVGMAGGSARIGTAIAIYHNGMLATSELRSQGAGMQ